MYTEQNFESKQHNKYQQKWNGTKWTSPPPKKKTLCKHTRMFNEVELITTLHSISGVKKIL